MKILVVHNRYQESGGEDSVFNAECDLLSANGHKVETMIYSNSVIRTGLDRFLSGLNSIYSPDSARRLKNKIAEFDPDIVHVHNFLPLVSPSVFIVAHRMNRAVVFTLHNYRMICPSATLFYKGQIYERSISTTFPVDAIWKAVYRNSRIQTAIVALITIVHKWMGTWDRRIDAYIALTEFAKMKFTESAVAIPADKIFVKPNFVKDCGRGDVDRAGYFLFVGRLTEEKGIRILLKAVESGRFKVVIIGDGRLKSEVEEAARQYKEISYLGFQQKAIVLKYMKECKALIFPSIWYEGFPVTIAEAFATGTPVIASDLGSMSEIIQDNWNGLLFQAGNAQALITRVKQVAADHALSKTLSNGARVSYQNNYTPERNYVQLMGIYREVLVRRAAATHREMTVYNDRVASRS